LSENDTFNDFAKEIRRIISVADERKVPIRILGGAAIRIHCPKYVVLYERLKRVPKHDMDFVTYSKFRPLTKKLFVDLGYEPYVSLMLTGATGRHRN
jgi:Na+-transporting NADH:ubiquinone oxidoreductase subunit NqrF